MTTSLHFYNPLKQKMIMLYFLHSVTVVDNSNIIAVLHSQTVILHIVAIANFAIAY